MTATELRPTRLKWWWMLTSLGLLAGTALVALLLGPVEIEAPAVLRSIVDGLPFTDVETGLDHRQQAIVFELRLPRVVLGILVGAMLALAGGAYQGSFRNPLADPYLLGAAAGAGLGATLAIAYGPDETGDVNAHRTSVNALGILALQATQSLLGRSFIRVSLVDFTEVLCPGSRVLLRHRLAVDLHAFGWFHIESS